MLIWCSKGMRVRVELKSSTVVRRFQFELLLSVATRSDKRASFFVYKKIYLRTLSETTTTQRDNMITRNRSRPTNRAQINYDVEHWTRKQQKVAEENNKRMSSGSWRWNVTNDKETNASRHTSISRSLIVRSSTKSNEMPPIRLKTMRNLFHFSLAFRSFRLSGVFDWFKLSVFLGD